VTDVDLLGVARRVAGDARPGEQVEAYALRSRDVDVKVFDGEVESLAVAEVEGVGIRVIVGSRQGYAWAGTLDADVIAETLDEARDNAGFGAPDESYVLGTPADAAGVDASVLDLWRDDVMGTPTATKVALTLELEAATRAADPRVRGVESASYGDAAMEAAVANSLGLEAATRRTVCSCSAFAMAGEGTATQTGSGFSAGRSFAEIDAQVAANDAAERAVRLLGARQIPSAKLPVILDPLVTRSVLALVGGALSGEAIVKGRSSVGRARRSPGPRSRWSTTPRWSRRSAPPPTMPRASPPVGSSSSPGVVSTRSCTTSPPRDARARVRARPDPRCAAGSSRRPAWAHGRSIWCRGRSAPRRSWRRCPPRSTCSR
jgi:PmbA protein